MRGEVVVMTALMVVGLGACQPSAAAENAVPAAPVVKAAPAAARTLARVVFVDKEQACECTQAKVDAAWKAIQTVLTGAKAVPVERVHMDTQADVAQVYRAKQPMVAVPGVYFLDAKGDVIELLQGDVTEAQLRAVVQ